MRQPLRATLLKIGFMIIVSVLIGMLSLVLYMLCLIELLPIEVMYIIWLSLLGIGCLFLIIPSFFNKPPMYKENTRQAYDSPLKQSSLYRTFGILWRKLTSSNENVKPNGSIHNIHNIPRNTNNANNSYDKVIPSHTATLPQGKEGP